MSDIRVFQMDNRWQLRGREVLTAATRAAKRGEAEAGNWLAGHSLEVLTVAQMAGVSERGLCRLVDNIRMTRHVDNFGRVNNLQGRSWQRF